MFLMLMKDCYERRGFVGSGGESVTRGGKSGFLCITHGGQARGNGDLLTLRTGWQVLGRRAVKNENWAGCEVIGRV